MPDHAILAGVKNISLDKSTVKGYYLNNINGFCIDGTVMRLHCDIRTNIMFMVLCFRRLRDEMSVDKSFSVFLTCWGFFVSHLSAFLSQSVERLS